MSLDHIRSKCLTLKGTTESIKWGDHLCFSVGEKMYLVITPDHTPISCSIKTSDELFNELTTREGIIPAPYMASHKWVHVDDINRIKSKEWDQLIQIAYDHVFEKLPAKIKKVIAQL